MLLINLELSLQSFEKELASFGLPQSTAEDLARVENITNTDPVVIRKEMDYDVPELRTCVEETLTKFTEDQVAIYKIVMDAVSQKQSLWTFINVRGSCGMTFFHQCDIGSREELGA